MLSNTSSSELEELGITTKMGVDGDRKVKKEAMFQYGKIHARGIVMSDFCFVL